MKRGFFCLCIVLLLCLLWTTFPEIVYAEEAAVSDTLTEESGVADLTDGLDWDVQKTLDKLGISMENPTEITNQFTLASVWNVLAEMAENYIAAPLRLLGGLLAVIIFAALLDGFSIDKQSAIGRLFEYICALGAVGILAEPLFQSFSAAESALQQGTTFMLTFVPVFAGILAAGGTAGGAVCYQTAVIALADGMMQLINRTLLPLCTMSFGLAIVDSVSPSVSVGGLLQMTRKAVTWCLGLLMSVFLGVLSLQNWISSSVDGAAVKTTKYVISNFVPVVGSAVSDAYATVRGSLQILRGATGIVGIASLCILFLPPLIQLLFYRGVIAVGTAAAELFGTQRMVRLLKGTQQALAIAFALLICFGIMFVVATAIAVTVGKNGA